MKHYIAYDKDCFDKLVWHEFNSKAEAEAFAELLDMKFLEHDDRIYDNTEIQKAVTDYLTKRKKHIEVTGGKP